MPATAQPPPAPAGPPLTTRAFLIAWVAFWALLLTVALQDHWQRGHTDLWRPLLWELSSCVVASVAMALAWRHLPRLDGRLAEPARWVRWPLALLLPSALAFVAVVYALRHGVYALAGQHYVHPPWPQVLAYEVLKFSMFYLLFAAVIFGLRTFAAWHAERLRAEAHLTAAREAQLLQLAQQIEPHFLFNALNTVASAIPADPALAERLLLRLARLLRAATDQARQPMAPLREELELLRAYTEIMEQRFGERVALRWPSLAADPTLGHCQVPTLIVQPLVENAFRHGVEKHPGPVALAIEVQRDGPRLRIAVDCSAGHLPGPAAPASGVGLANVRRRLALLYGNEAQLTLHARIGGGVRATLELPCAC